MLILVVFFVGLAALRLGGADLRRLNDLRLRLWGLAIAAIGTQAAIVSVFSRGWHVGHLIVNLGTYGAVGLFLWVNRRIPWLWVIAVGTGANTLAISANGGVMPASATAIAITHLSARPGFANSAPVAHPHLLVLGDVIPTPPWLPFHNVASIGDVLIVTGALLLVAHQTRWPPDELPDLADGLRDERGGASGAGLSTGSGGAH